MSVIFEALDKLDAAVLGLETSMDPLAIKLAGCQRDMFDPSVGPNMVQLDRETVVKRIDTTIQRVENLLQEED